MKPVHGEVSFFDNGTVIAGIDDETPYEINTSSVKEALVKAGVGCGLIYLKLTDDINPNEHILCRFSMSGLKEAGELCKIINYYIKTGKAIFSEKTDESICKKCGRPFVEEMSV